MKIRSIALAGCAVAAAIAGSAHASIVATTGAAELIAAPADARLNALTSATSVRVWDELQNIVLADPLRANAREPGLYDANSDLDEVVIPRGSVVSSHYIHFDSPGSTQARAEGSVTFDAPIAGVMVLGDSGANRFLDNSDFLGAPTLYPDNVSARGLELSANGDRFSISADRRTVTFSFAISNPGDYMRVVTIPAPGAMALAGASGLIALRRRRA